MASGTANEPERLVITRVFNAPPEVVWKAWTDPQYAKQWWGPKDFTAPFCEIDFRVGGKFRFCMRSPDGHEFWTGGEYHEIVPLKKIVFSLYPTDADGKEVDPAAYGIQHEAVDGAHDEVHFEDLGNGKTRLTMIGNETMQNARESGQLEGWNQILDKFEATLTTVNNAA